MNPIYPLVSFFLLFEAVHFVSVTNSLSENLINALLILVCVR